MDFRLLYPHFKKKAVTFSYDDGVIQDKKIIDIFNKYNIKATFNLSYGKSKEKKTRLNKNNEEIDCSYLDLDKDYKIYEGHEITSHSFSHPHMESLAYDKQKEEVVNNMNELSSLFNSNVEAFCYPYGTYNQDTLSILKELNITYSRTTRSTYSFNLPCNFLLWNPTIHHRDKRIFEIIDNFKKADNELALLYIWGHSYEFAIDDNFSLLEDIILKLNEDKDIIYLTNGEIYKYVNDASMVYFRDDKFINPSDSDVYLICNNKNILVKKRGVTIYE